MFGDDDELRAAHPRAGRDRDARRRRPARRPGVGATGAVRAVRRRELLRMAVADVLGLVDVDAVGEALTDIAAATLSGGLVAAVRSVEAHGSAHHPDPDRGRRDGAVRRARARLRQRRRRDVRARPVRRAPTRRRPPTRRRRWPASSAGCSPRPRPTRRLGVDADLRPEGRQGPLVRSLASYAAYYARWSLVWEAQALLRAESVCGDPGPARALQRPRRRTPLAETPG